MESMIGEIGLVASTAISVGSVFIASEPTPTPTPTVTLTQASSLEHSPTTASAAVPGFEAIAVIPGLLTVAYLAKVRRK